MVVFDFDRRLCGSLYDGRLGLIFLQFFLFRVKHARGVVDYNTLGNGVKRLALLGEFLTLGITDLVLAVHDEHL